MKDRIRKLIIVAVLTMFIWVWAFNAIEETITQSVTLTIASSATSDKQISFEGLDSPATIVLKMVGPKSKVTKLKNDVNQNGNKFQYTFNILDDDKYLSPDNVLDVIGFLEDRVRTELPEFSIESAVPTTIKVNVEELEQQTLDVMVVDEHDFRLTNASIKPRSTVDVYVRKDASPDLKAIVRLTDEQKAKARTSPITESFVSIAGELKQLSTELTITLPPTEELLQPFSFKPKFVGIAMSESMLGKYKIELNYDPSLKAFLASKEAQAAYKAEAPYQIIIEIKEEDWKDTQDMGDVSRAVIYKFPEEYVQKGEIRLADDVKPDMATFKVTRIDEK